MSKLHRIVLALLFACTALGQDKKPPVVEEKKPKLDRHGDALPQGAVARLGSVRLRHSEPVTFVALMPDGKTVLSTGSDFTIRLWDIKTGKELKRLVHTMDADLPRRVGMARPGRQYPFFSAMSADGKVLVTGMQQNKTIRLWDLAQWKEIKSLDGGFSINGLGVAPDGKHFYIGDQSSGIRVMDLTGKEVRTLDKEKEGVRIFGFSGGMSVSPDGKTLVASSLSVDNGMIRQTLKGFSTADGKQMFAIEPDNQGGLYPPMTTFSPDGKTFVAAVARGEFHLYNPADGKQIRPVKLAPRPQSVQFTPDGKTLIGMEQGGRRLSIFDAASGKLSKTIGKPGNNFARINYSPFGSSTTLSLSRDGKIAAVADGNGVRLVDLESGKDLVAALGHESPVSGIAFSRDGKEISTLGQDGTVYRWDVKDGKEIGTVASPVNAYSFQFSDDGRFLFVEDFTGKTSLLDSASRKAIVKLEMQTQIRMSMYAVSADGKTAAVRTRMDLATRLFSTETGKLIATFGTPHQPNQPIRGYTQHAGMAFSPDGSLFAALSEEGRLTIHEVDGGGVRREIGVPAGQLRDLAFSPDGRMLVLDMDDNRLVVHELATGTERRTYLPEGEGKKPPVEARPNFSYNPYGAIVQRKTIFSPDGRLVALVAEDRGIVVWDVLSGEHLGTFKGHDGDVNTLTFSPDGKSLASAGDDGTGLVWDLATLKKAKRSEEPTKDSLAKLWDDLRSSDSQAGFAAVRKLADWPTHAVAVLDEKLKIAEPIDKKIVEKYVADLDSRRFPVRKKAIEELEKMGRPAVPVLKQALAGKPSEELRKRVEELLDKARGQTMTPIQLQYSRGIEVLERAGTKETRAVLERLAKGPDGAFETTEAKAALSRLK